MFAKVETSKSDKKKVFKTNCCVCGVELKQDTCHKSPLEGDTRYYCHPHWKKRYGKKKKLIKRY